MNQRTTKPEEQTKRSLADFLPSPEDLQRHLLTEPELLSSVFSRQVDLDSIRSSDMMAPHVRLPGASEAVFATLQVQFGESDLRYVDRAMTYSILERTRFSILIAEKFRPEHLTMIHNLNDFGLPPVVALQAELVRSGSSPLKLDFNMVAAKPEEPAPTSVVKELCREYWATFSAAAGTALRPSLNGQPDALSNRSTIWCPNETAKFNVTLSSTSTRITFDIGLLGQIPEMFHRAIYHEIHKHRYQIETALEAKLFWCSDTHSTTVLVAGGYETDHETGAEATVEALTRLHDALAPALMKLPWERLNSIPA